MDIQEDIWKVCKDHNYTWVTTGVYTGRLRMKVSQEHTSPYKVIGVTGWDNNGNDSIHFTLDNIKSYDIGVNSMGTTLSIVFTNGNKITLNQ